MLGQLAAQSGFARGFGPEYATAFDEVRSHATRQIVPMAQRIATDLRPADGDDLTPEIDRNEPGGKHLRQLPAIGLRSKDEVRAKG